LVGVGDLVAQETGVDAITIGGFAGEPSGYEIAQQIALTRTVYNLLGQSVIYQNAGNVIHCKMVIQNVEQESVMQLIGGDASARVQIEDVQRPARGDVIATRQGTEHVVDQYRRLNWAEWELDLRNASD